MKKQILLIFLFLFMYNATYANNLYNCSYSGKIEDCIKAQDKNRTIEDFVCIQGTKERIVYQIILDEKFKILDLEIEKYLDELTKSKDYYFGANRVENYTVAIDEIENNLGTYGEFAYKYKQLCSTSSGSIISDAIGCLGDSTSVTNSKDFLDYSDCEGLYQTKLSVYRDIAYNTLKTNKNQVMKDTHKVFTQSQRGKYNYLLDIIRINIGYIERLWKKWPSKTYYTN